MRRDEWSLPALGYERRALDHKFMRRLLDMKELLLLFSSVLLLAAGGIAFLLGAAPSAGVLDARDDRRFGPLRRLDHRRGATSAVEC